MDKEKFFRFGHFTKPFGLGGELFLFVETDLSDAKKTPEEIFIEEEGKLTPKKVLKLEFRNKGYLILIEGVDDRTKAEAMTKKEIFLPKDFLPPLKKNQFYFHEIIGCSVIDTNFGEVGVVEKVIAHPQQDLLVVKRDKTEILIPLLKNFLSSLDRTKKVLTISVPEGLIELYLNPPKNTED